MDTVKLAVNMAHYAAKAQYFQSKAGDCISALRAVRGILKATSPDLREQAVKTINEVLHKWAVLDCLREDLASAGIIALAECGIGCGTDSDRVDAMASGDKPCPED